MADPFVAEIRVFGFNFAPTGWARCDGQLLPINQNQALFSLLGTSFGGNGTNNFALPDLGDRFALGAGAGPGLTPRSVGETGGTATVALQMTEMPQHGHALNATASPALTSPAAAAQAPTANGAAVYRTPGVVTPMAGESLGVVGGGNPHENRPPYLALNFCIALQGIFPPRS
jgi:microcystin-dependent protein